MLDIDLFAGAGGLAIGLQKAGFTPVSLFEKDKFACEALRHNSSSKNPTLRGTIKECDVHDVNWKSITTPVRLLAAGAPCQPISLGGRHLADQDGRNLFPEILRAVRALHPRAVLLENVRGFERLTQTISKITQSGPVGLSTLVHRAYHFSRNLLETRFADNALTGKPFGESI